MTTSEDTINDLIADYLRGHFGIDLTTQSIGVTRFGGRKPDFELHSEGKIYYGEGEWLRTYHRGLEQAIDFGEIPGASGYFLLGYPDDLREQVTERRRATSDPAELLKGAVFQRCLFKPEGRRADVRQVPLDGLSDWIRSVLAPSPPPPEPSEYLKLMRSIVDDLSTFLPRARGSSRLFEHVIATIPQQGMEEDAARKGSSYLLLNQLVFYRILAEHLELGFAPMDGSRIKGPPDVSEYFQRVLLQDYRAIFQTNVIDLFPQRAFPFIRSLVKLVSHLRPEEFTKELLGSIFHSLIPLQVRKPVAAYYTNPTAARLLVRLAGVSGPDHVGDFACGSGTLLVAAYEEKARTDARPENQSRHAAYLERELTGMDIMPFAAHMAVVQLALLNPVRWTNKVQVAVEDSTDQYPGQRIRSLTRRAISPQTRLSNFEPESRQERTSASRGALSADGAGSDFVLRSQDVVLMNPPFSRKQFITPEYRAQLSKSFSDYSRFASNEMGLWGYFVLLGDRFCKYSGVVAYVLPVAILRQESSRGLRRLLSSTYQLKYIVMSSVRSAFSEDAINREVLLVACKGGSDLSDCTLVMLNEPLTETNLDLVYSTIAGGESSDKVLLHRVSQSEFASSDDWLSLVPGTSIGGERPTQLEKSLVPLRSLTGFSLIQGIRMEAGSNFVSPADTLLSHERDARTRTEWTISRDDSKGVVASARLTGVEVSVPRAALFPSTRSITGLRRLEIQSPPDYVVCQRFRGDEAFWHSPNPQAMLMQRREHVKSRAAKIVLAGYGNLNIASPGTSLLAVYSKQPLAPTWNCWSLNVQSDEDAKLLTLWWNSSFNLSYLMNNSTEVGGSLLKWRKQVVELAPSPSLRKLDSRSRERALRAFDKLSSKDFPSLMEQFSRADPLRVALDDAAGGLIDFPRNDQRAWLNDFYLSLSNELSSMASRTRADSVG